MAALTAERETALKDGNIVSYPVKASSTIYKGAMVMILPASGYAEAAADTATGLVIGVAKETVDNSAGSDGDLNILIQRKGVFNFNASSIAITDVGATMYVVDDQTFDETDPGNTVACGKLVKFISSTEGEIDLGL